MLWDTNQDIEWPGITELPDFKLTFPKFKGASFESHFKSFDKLGLDLLEQMIQLNPAKRISVKAALNHPFFDDLPKADFL